MKEIFKKILEEKLKDIIIAYEYLGLILHIEVNDKFIIIDDCHYEVEELNYEYLDTIIQDFKIQIIRKAIT